MERHCSDRHRGVVRDPDGGAQYVDERLAGYQSSRINNIHLNAS
jgi:hypothetical protein